MSVAPPAQFVPPYAARPAAAWMLACLVPRPVCGARWLPSLEPEFVSLTRPTAATDIQLSARFRVPWWHARCHFIAVAGLTRINASLQLTQRRESNAKSPGRGRDGP